MSVDSTDGQANATTKMHFEMSATAKYTGRVGDNAYLEAPVKAEIDYTFNFLP